MFKFIIYITLSLIILGCSDNVSEIEQDSFNSNYDVANNNKIYTEARNNLDLNEIDFFHLEIKNLEKNEFALNKDEINFIKEIYRKIAYFYLPDNQEFLYIKERYGKIKTLNTLGIQKKFCGQMWSIVGNSGNLLASYLPSDKNKKLTTLPSINDCLIYKNDVEKFLLNYNKSNKQIESGNKYEYRTQNNSGYEYNYDVSGTDSEGNYVYGNITIMDNQGNGYVYDENDNEIYIDVYWIGYGALEAYDENGEFYDLTVD